MHQNVGAIPVLGSYMSPVSSSTGTLVCTQLNIRLTSSIPLSPFSPAPLSCMRRRVCAVRDLIPICSNFAGCSHHFPSRERRRGRGQGNVGLLSPPIPVGNGSKAANRT